MPSKIQRKVTPGVLTQTIVTDEVIFRKLANELTVEMPFNELCLIFKFTKIDPRSEETFKKLNYPYTHEDEVKQLIELCREGLLLFEAEVRHPEKLPQIEYYQNPKP